MPVPPALIAEHRFLAQDNLNDCIANIAYYLQNSAAVGSQSRLTVAAPPVAIAATETLIAAMPLTIPFTFEGNTYPGTMKVGSVYRAILAGTYTAAAGSAPVFTIRAGTAGTVAGDTSVATATFPASATSGTAILFNALVVMEVTSLGLTGAVTGYATITNPQGTSNATASTGITVIANAQVALAGTGTMATTTATFIDLSMTAGASNSASITFAEFQIDN